VRRSTPSLLLCAVLALLLTSCGDDSSQFLRHDPDDAIKIGVKSDQPGTGWAPDGYHFSGFDIDVVHRLAKDLHFQATLVPVASQDRKTALTHEDGSQVDLVIATFSITPSRVKDLYFAGPYAKTYQGFMVRKNGPEIRTRVDLRRRRVCTWNGTNSTDTLSVYLPEAIPDAGATAAECVARLRKGEVAAVSTDQMILYGFAHRYPDLMVVPGLRIGTPNYYGVAMAKTDRHGDSNRKYCEMVRDALKAFIDDSAWQGDMESKLPLFTKDKQWMTLNQPSRNDINRLSCTDDIQ
jgi:glutamate transport system substrate-binding protein